MLQVAVCEALGWRCSADWYALLLEQEACKEYFCLIVKRILQDQIDGAKIFPPGCSVFAWTQHCRLPDVRVVLIGQDPYHGEGQANGLAFSVANGCRIPPSLRNIFKELETDIAGFCAPACGDLTSWSQQGVLLLNTALTVKAGVAASHSAIGWQTLTDGIIKHISNANQNVVFLLWGRHAAKKEALISNTKHLILKAAHPSPLSAHRGFFGCRHFSLANAYLIAHKRQEIDWSSICSK